MTTKWRHTASGRVRLHTPPASGGPLTARSPKMAAGHRAGRSRATPSQWSRSEVSSHDIKQNMCVVSARISIRGRRADRPRSGPLCTVPSPRRPRIEILAEITYFFLLVSITRPLGAPPLRRDGSAAAGAVPGRRPLRGLESAQDRPPGRGAQCAFTASHERDHHRVTGLRTLVMRPVVILIGYTHISTTTAALGYLSQALCGTRPDRPTSA